MKKKDTVFDEMQNYKLLKIEEFGFWMVFWVLFAAIIIQALIGAALKEIIGEIAALFIASAYVAYSCLKKGLWTRRKPPSHKANAISGAVAAAAIGIIHAVRVFVVLQKPLKSATILHMLLICAGTFILCFMLLEVFYFIHNRRRMQLDGIEEEEGR